MHPKNKTRSGFTVIELLVVVSIMGLLSSLIFVSIRGVQKNARDAKRVADLDAITKGLELYYNQYNQYPPLAVHPTWTGNWCDLTPSCLAQADQNWDSMISALRSANILTVAQPAPQSWFQKLAAQIIPDASASGTVQDPQYPLVRYEYMPAAVPLNQNYRLRVALENPKSALLQTSITGKFFWSEDYKATGPDSCDSSLGFYCTGPGGNYQAYDPGKPVVYLYPTKTENVSVTISPKSVDQSIPAYNNGWNVVAHPNGQIYNPADGQKYPYLFWEGQSAQPIVDRTKGFVTASGDVRTFLADKLSQQGLKPSEYNEFIDYWAPRMQGKNYVYVYFMPQADYSKIVPMNISPKPDTVIRVYMLFKSLDAPISVQPEVLSAPARNGFTVVEWGGNRSQLP